MASIKIHQDLFNYERKRKGFTNQQILGIAGTVIICAGFTAILSYLFSVPIVFAMNIGLILGFPCLVFGFLPIYGMRADEFLNRFLALNERGNALNFEGYELPPMKGVTSRAYKKKCKRNGAECR